MGSWLGTWPPRQQQLRGTCYRGRGIQRDAPGCGLANIDGDGDLDALAADRNGYETSYYLNNGNGTFGAKHIRTH
ncbi:MAG: VCBS repeat-containing protein [Flavobacteriales bacterium]|nr:VCBS repeat-containing protein [Flavobacteriales bacterium]